MRRLLPIVTILFTSSAWAGVSFELKQMNGANPGSIYRSSDHPGPVFVYEFYFNTCPYCNDNAPIIDQLAERNAENPRVQVLDISRDCRDADYRSWISKHNPNHPVLNDCNKVLIGPHQVQGYPTTVIVDCNGKVQYRHEGSFGSEELEQVQAAIDTSLNQMCRAK